MAKRDYYEILGVARDAKTADIKQAFRKLAMKHHPDRNPDNKAAEEKFKEAKEAYEILSDDKKRAIYDQMGHAGVEQTASAYRGGAGSAGFNFDDIFGDIGSIFSDVFGGRQGGPGGMSSHAAGADLRYRLTLSLEEAIKGVTKEIQVRTLVKCEECGGSGAKKGSTPKRCADCNGSGFVRIQQGFFSIQQPCPTCHGKGKIIGDPCTACHGQGRQHKTKTLSVKVPPGIDTGDQVRLTGEGEAGLQGGPAGDLYIEMFVTEHAIFQRKEADLYCEIPVSFVVASLGGEVDVPTLDGKIKLKIPAETQSGKLLRLKGKGARTVRGHHTGDLICRILVEIPVKLTKAQKTLLEEFDQLLQQGKTEHLPLLHAWTSKIKKFFEHFNH